MSRPDKCRDTVDPPPARPDDGAQPLGVSPEPSIPPLRTWLRGPSTSPEEAAAFAEHTRELMARFWPGLGLVIASAALLWWPVDHLVYPEDPHIRDAFASFRIKIAIIDVGLALLAPRIAFAHRHAHAGAALSATVNLVLAGDLLAQAGQGDPLWLYYAFMCPFFSVLLVMPLRARILTALMFTSAIFSAWLIHPLAHWDTPGVSAGLSFLCFCTVVGIFIGHLLYVQVERSFHLGRRVEEQRQALAAVAGQLEVRVVTQTKVIRDLGVRAQIVRAEQRLEIARELHDSLGQELTSMHLLVDLGLRLHDDQDVTDSFSRLGEQIQRIQGSLRQVLVSLRPQILEDSSLVESLMLLVGESGRLSGLECVFHPTDVPEVVSPAMSLAVFRIAQEALTNAIRHARANRIDVRLDGRDDLLLLQVIDDGRGIEQTELGRGFGTRGIQERVRALGGQASWIADRGTHLTVTLPLARSA